LQPDGKIIAAGSAVQSGGGGVNFALARYDSNGNLDPTFGAGGKVTTDFFGSTDQANAIVLQPDGKIVAGGEATGSGGNLDFALARYDSSGSLDTSFGTGGKVVTDFFGANDDALDVELQPDGKIVAAGSANKPGSGFRFALARYDSGGHLDSTFGAGGRVADNSAISNEAIQAIVLQPDGKIVAAGDILRNGTFDFALARYDSAGSLDPTFGNGGKVTTDFFGLSDGALDVALQPDGKIVAAGNAGGNGFNIDFALARYDGGGNLDPTFGIGGKATTDFMNRSGDFARAVALQPDGKIVAVGEAFLDGGVLDFAVARYQSRQPCRLAITNASVDKPVLWPPDHQLVPVFVNYGLNNSCPANCALSVTSNEPVSGTSPGDLSPDWLVVKPNLVRLRAERADSGKGRVYTIQITCRDIAGNAAGQTVTVRVPRN
jgi:uncharacterized delta-60 repeat protein